MHAIMSNRCLRAVWQRVASHRTDDVRHTFYDYHTKLMPLYNRVHARKLWCEHLRSLCWLHFDMERCRRRHRLGDTVIIIYAIAPLVAAY